MRALNLIEAYNLNAFDLDDYKRHLALPDRKYFFHTYLHFVSQKFEYDMIEKYFEGWEYSEEGEYARTIDLQSVPEGYDKGFTWWIDLASGWDINRTFEYRDGNLREDYLKCPNPPETLHDFIRDCQRSGIELILKKDILRGE